MKITILGAGGAASHYLPGKKTNMYPPAFLIQWGAGEKILFECSQAADIRLEMAGVDYASIHHIAISHPHPDHCVPIPFIMAVFTKGLWGGEQFKNNGLTFYGPDHLIKNIPALWNVYLADKEGKYPEWPKLALIPMSREKKKLKVGTGFLSAKPVYHSFGKADALAYRLETPEGIVAYSGDTGDCTGIREIAKDADVFICEANARIGDFKDAQVYGHLNPYVVGDIAKRANVKKVILFHYIGYDSDVEMINEVKRAGFTGEVIPGKDLQKISF
jgi:ribonuclease BN (tRNA processing enzyme)